MTRKEICLKWLNGELNDEEVRKLIDETPVPPLMDVDPLAETDSWYDGDYDNTIGSIYLVRYAAKDEESKAKVDEFLHKFWKR